MTGVVSLSQSVMGPRLTLSKSGSEDCVVRATVNCVTGERVLSRGAEDRKSVV